jgi:hypothetical protein
MRMTNITRRRRSGLMAIALGGMLVVATGISASAGPVTAATAADAVLAYTCGFASGQQQVDVRVAATFSSAVTVGKPIQPTGVRVTMTVPESALAQLTKPGAVRVTGSAQLGVTVALNGSSTTAQWSALTLSNTPIPGAGSLRLVASGAVPSVTLGTPGEASFSAGAFVMVLSLQKAGGEATSPATLSLPCIARPGQDTRLATTQVTAAAGQPAATRGNLITVGAQPYHQETIQPQDTIVTGAKVPFTGYATGFSNVRKMNGSAILGEPAPGTPDEDLLIPLYEDNALTDPADCVPLSNLSCAITTWNSSQLDYQGKPELPPVTSTFLAFGFIPVTATLELTEAEPSNCGGDRSFCAVS